MVIFEDEIYPLTITCDRYTGAYSGGKYTAWNLDPEEIPTDINDEDEVCCNFWGTNKEDKYVIGRGNTASEALTDLYIKLKRANEI